MFLDVEVRDAADQLRQPVVAEALRRLPISGSLRVVAATLGDDAGPVGAARAAMLAR